MFTILTFSGRIIILWVHPFGSPNYSTWAALGMVQEYEFFYHSSVPIPTDSHWGFAIANPIVFARAAVFKYPNANIPVGVPGNTILEEGKAIKVSTVKIHLICSRFQAAI